MIAAVILFLTVLLSPLSVLAADQGTSAAASPSPTPTWDLKHPSSCSVEGPSPCPKCSITCNVGQRPLCTPGTADGSPATCVQLPACACK
jgi:hypothetical protein